MTQYNDSNFIPYAQPSGTGRPTVVTVLAIIGIVFGGFGLLGGLGGLAFNIVAMMRGSANPMLPGMPLMSKSLLVYGIATTPIHLILSVMEIVGCVAALSLKDWGRKTMLVWSIATVIWSIAITIVQAVWVTPMTMKMVGQAQPNNPMANSQFVTFFTYGGAVVSLAFSCVMPALFLILWRRDDVKNAFQGVRPA